MLFSHGRAPTATTTAIFVLLAAMTTVALAATARDAAEVQDMQEVSRRGGHKYNKYKHVNKQVKHGYYTDKKKPSYSYNNYYKNDKGGKSEKKNVCSIPNVASDFYNVSAGGVKCSSDPYDYVPCCAGNAVCVGTQYDPLGCFSSRIGDFSGREIGPMMGNPAPDGFCCLPDGADILGFVDKICNTTTSGRFAPVDYCLTDNAPELENIACICCQQVAYIADDLSWASCGNMGDIANSLSVGRSPYLASKIYGGSNCFNGGGG